MKFYRLKTGKTLHSFGDSIGDTPILHKPLAQWQREIIEGLNGELIDIEKPEDIATKDPYFLFDEDLYFSEHFMRKCLAMTLTQKRNLHFVVNQSEFNDRYILPHPNDTENYHVFTLFYYCTVSESEYAVVEQKIFEHSNYLPDQIVKGRKFPMHQSDTFAGHIISPFHLLYLNLAANLGRTVKFQEKIPSFIRKRFGQNHGKWFYRGLKRMNIIGKNCQIHPTALIEGSIIGDNTIIGAHSIVRLSNLAPNSYVSDNVSVINSILGERTFIANSNYINSCLCFKEVFLIHGPYQLSVFGDNVACFAVINCDIRLDQATIKIPTSEGLLDSDQPTLGVAYGHRSKTGGGNIVAAGRIVPNDLHIAPPDNIILSFDKK